MTMLRMITLFYVFLVFTHLALCSYTCPPSSDATPIKRLKSKLFCDYDPQVRPVKNTEKNITVKIWLTLNYFSFVGYENKFELSAYIIMNWQDEFLSWDPMYFQSISELQVSSTQIWFPDVMIINTNMKQHELNGENTCEITYEGQVQCTPIIDTQVYCQQFLQRWPYDKQICYMGVISYSQESKLVDFQLNHKGHTDDFTYVNNEWNVLNISADRLLPKGDNYTWTELFYVIEVQRHAGLYAATIVAPAFVLSALTLISFWVRGVKTRVLLCCTSLIGNTIFLIYIGLHIVSAGEFAPDIAYFYRDAMIITVVALVIAITVERGRDIYFNYDAPIWLSSSVKWMRERGGRAGELLVGDGDEEMEQNSQDEVKPSRCSNFMTLLDRLAFIIILITYGIMLAALLP